MRETNTIKTKYLAACIIAVFFILPFTASAALPPDYTHAISQAQAHINNPSGWIPTDGSIITITGNSATENPSFGLTYNNSFSDGNNYLIVRTLTNVGYYANTSSGALQYGVGAYTTYDDNPTKYQQASWVTTGNDATKFIDTNVTSPSSLVTTMESGLGMNNAGSHTAIVEYAVLPNNNNLMRPTLNPDISTYPTDASSYGYSNPFTPNKPSGMSDAVYTYLQKYLDYWQTTALGGAGTFPWTQLGYTYFWGNGDALNQIKGMSEFIILGGTQVKIIGIYSPESYMYTKNKNGVFSTDSDAEYGNGFASFNVTGNCDTIWAGNAFQVNASSDPSNPNQIIIAKSSTISGGQGILVWSPNYTVTNYGTISGATLKKLRDDNSHPSNPGMLGTDNVALLFLGDTTYGNIAGGKNILINSGRISSDPSNSSTAVEADAGNTEITNSGTISGYTYGIHFLSGSNKITNTGTIAATGGVGALAAIQIDSGTTAVNSTGGVISGDVILANNSTAALDVGNTNLPVTGTYVQNPNSTLKLTANSPTDFGKVTATSNLTSVDLHSNVIVTVGGYIPNNTTLSNVVSGTGSNSINVPATISSSSPIFTFSSANGTGDHLSLTATRANSYSSFATNANSSAVGGVLNTIANSATASGDITNILGALDSLGSGNQIDQALSSLTPNVNNSCPQVNYETQTRFINTTVEHINTVFQATPASSGGLDPAVWAQPFGTYLHQDPRGTSNGYNASVWGILGGYDKQVRNDLAFGVSIGYARDEIRTKDFSGQTGVDSYQLGLYGSFTRSAYYIDGIFSFAYNRYDSSREINFGGLNLTPASNYDGQQYSLYFEGGYNFNFNKLEITPLASIQYMRLNIDGYTEKNADAADLTVDGQGYNLLQSGLGARIAYTLEKKNFTVIPDFHFKWLYNFINDNQQATSTFAGGGASFPTSGFNQPRSSYNLGTKWTILTKNNISFSLNYDYELKPGFYSHSGYINVRHEF
ncbi:MAG: autotransporter domain-containing protein [Candidatus Omnitrophota bacterium]|jgi:outer membrane autotransporter protein